MYYLHYMCGCCLLYTSGYRQEADTNCSYFFDSDTGELTAMANRDGRLFRMMFRYQNLEKCIVAMSIKKWHEKLEQQKLKIFKTIGMTMCVKDAFMANISISHIQEILKWQKRYLSLIHI